MSTYFRRNTKQKKKIVWNVANLLLLVENDIILLGFSRNSEQFDKLSELAVLQHNT